MRKTFSFKRDLKIGQEEGELTTGGFKQGSDKVRFTFM